MPSDSSARRWGPQSSGHYGDRISRKSTLIATLLLMGAATFLVAFVPTYEHIGIWGAVLLTVLRFIQGVGVGGEWGGSVLMSMEWTKTQCSSRLRGLRGRSSASRRGLFLANLSVLALSEISGSQFLIWGVANPISSSSIFLVAIGLYIRLNILETPVFRRLVSENKIERTPMLEVIKRQPRDILLSALARMGEQAPFSHLYRIRIYLRDQGSGCFARTASHSRSDEFCAVIFHDTVLRLLVRPVRPQTHVHDRRRRDRRVRFHLLCVAPTPRSLPGFFLGIILSLIPHNMMYGPQAALIAESFTGPAALQAGLLWAISWHP